jgi:predicted TIM-barrel fold metal-dependent hydrolase
MARPMESRKMKSLLAFVLFLTFSVSTQAASAAQYDGPIIDAHAHLRLGDGDELLPTQPIGTDALRKLDAAAGVQQSALIVMAPKGEPEKTRAQNDAVLAAAARSQNRFYPVVSVHPADGDVALMELERVAGLGAKEVKLHPNTQNFDVSDPGVGSVVERCGELGLVVLFDSYKPWDPAEMGKFMLLAIQHPKTKIVLAHMGYTYFREAVSFSTLHRLGMADNVWFDISAIATTFAGSPVQAELVWTMRKVGMNRILFGSDWPVYTPKEAEAAVRHLGLTAVEQRQVFHDNAAQLLRLSAATKMPKPAD